MNRIRVLYNNDDNTINIAGHTIPYDFLRIIYPYILTDIHDRARKQSKTGAIAYNFEAMDDQVFKDILFFLQLNEMFDNKFFIDPMDVFKHYDDES